MFKWTGFLSLSQLISGHFTYVFHVLLTVYKIIFKFFISSLILISIQLRFFQILTATNGLWPGAWWAAKISTSFRLASKSGPDISPFRKRAKAPFSPRSFLKKSSRFRLNPVPKRSRLEARLPSTSSRWTSWKTRFSKPRKKVSKSVLRIYETSSGRSWRRSKPSSFPNSFRRRNWFSSLTKKFWQAERWFTSIFSHQPLKLHLWNSTLFDFSCFKTFDSKTFISQKNFLFQKPFVTCSVCTKEGHLQVNL